MSKILEFPSNGDGKRTLWWLGHLTLAGEPERLVYIPLEAIGRGVQEIGEKAREVGKPVRSLWLELVEIPGEVPNVG
jgi:hypothetical protein